MTTIYLRCPVGCGESKSQGENGRERLGQVVRTVVCIVILTDIVTNDTYMNEVMDASCEPLDLILLPGMRPLVCV